MTKFRISPGLWLTFGLSVFIFFLGIIPQLTEPMLQFDRNKVINGEWWRLLTGQLVHYGTYHLAMNIAALLLCGYVLLNHCSLIIYCGLILLCGFCVGAGIYWGNQELIYYAGFSGILHGMILFGLVYTFRETPWFNCAALTLVAAKLWQEQSSDYRANDLQSLLPVPVAVDAHLYGAAGGLLCSVIFFAWIFSTHKKISADSD